MYYGTEQRWRHDGCIRVHASPFDAGDPPRAGLEEMVQAQLPANEAASGDAPPNGSCYPQVSGRGRQCHVDGTSLKPEKCAKTRRLAPVGLTLGWALL